MCEFIATVLISNNKMKKSALWRIVIFVGCCASVILTGFLSSRRHNVGVQEYLPQHSVLLQIDEIGDNNGGHFYQASLTTADTQIISQPLINKRDLSELVNWEGKIYTNHCNIAHKHLFHALRELIAAHVMAHDTIYAILNGDFWNLAIEAIPLANDSGYLCDQYYFRRISSAKQINHHPIRPDKHEAILFGDMSYNSPNIKNLLGSKHAIAYLRELFPTFGLQPEIYAQDTATAQAFLNLSGRHADVVLVSTHGDVRTQADNSFAYEVLFNNADGVPTYKIAKMDLSQIQTIFFTACHSGCYVSHSNECLRTALKAAHANSIIFHIWRTYDSAAEIFMNTYYASWLAGMTPDKAFITAKDAVRAKMEEPTYWAGWVMLD